MRKRTPGKAWLRTLATRVAALGGTQQEDSPIPYPEFDGILTMACGAVQKRGNERSQGPDDFVQRAVGQAQLVKWFQEHHLSVQHDAGKPRTIRLMTVYGMGDSRHKHVWVDPQAHSGWVAGGAGAGWGVDPVEFDCRSLSLDETVVLTEAVHRHAFGASPQWNFRCTPTQITEIVARKRSRSQSLYPYIRLYEPDVTTIEALRRQVDRGLQDRASRIIKLFDTDTKRRKTI
jgi:hypothetical protein